MIKEDWKIALKIKFRLEKKMIQEQAEKQVLEIKEKLLFENKELLNKEKEFI